MTLSMHDPRRSFDRAEVLFMLRHVAIYPALGATVAVWLFATLARPQLPLPTELLDSVAVLCGVIGLVFGGVAGFSRPARERFEVGTAPFSLTRLVAAPAAALVIVALAGVPLTAIRAGALTAMAAAGALWLRLLHR